MPDDKTTKRDSRATAKQLADHYKSIRKKIISSARRQRRPKQDPEDVAQSVLEKILVRGEDEPIAQPGGYLRTAVKNALTDDFNKWRSEEEGKKEFESSCPSAAPSPEEICMTQDSLIKALEQLPADQLAAVILVRHKGLSYEEAARKMNITPRRLESLLAKALKRCRAIGKTTGEFS
jgi:RNA polymerase sigma-70 factor (ECF subfamily)